MDHAKTGNGIRFFYWQHVYMSPDDTYEPTSHIPTYIIDLHWKKMKSNNKRLKAARLKARGIHKSSERRTTSINRRATRCSTRLLLNSTEWAQTDTNGVGKALGGCTERSEASKVLFLLNCILFTNHQFSFTPEKVLTLINELDSCSIARSGARGIGTSWPCSAKVHQTFRSAQA